MSGSANRWTLRLSTEGADQVVRDLRAAATESAAAARAYDTLIKAQPQLATGAERAEQALRKNVDAMRSMRGELNLVGAAAQGAASSLGSFGAALTSPAAAIAGLTAAAGAGAVQIARLGDQYTDTMNKLRAATGSVQAASAVYSELVAMSQQTGASISESAGAFVRFSVAARAIGATNGEVLQLTRTIQQAGLISGASSQEAAAGVQQLGQALASGTLQGDELRSILENMPTLAEALAQQLGVSVGQLRTMGSEGQLTSDRVFQALLRASENINKQFTELTPTMGRAFGVLGQAMVEFVGKLDQALGLSQAIARAAAAAAAAVGRASGAITPSSPAERVEAAEQRLRTMQEQLRQAEEALAEQRRQFMPRNGSPERLAAAGRFADQDPQVQAQAQRIAALRQQIAAEGQVVTQARAEQDQAARQADDARQAEEATAAARRLAAARAAQTTAFNSTRDALDQERKLRTDHATRITAIDAGLANGNTDAAGAARLRRMANDELADGLKALDAAARGRVETDESLAEVMRAVIDIEKDRTSLMRDGETVTQSVRTEVEKYADELARLNNLLGAGAISQDTYNRAVAAADPAVKAAADAAKRIEQENTRTTDRITSFFGDAFARAFEGTGNGFRGLMDSFKRAAISTFASIAAQAIIRPIIAPIIFSLGLGQLSSGNISGLFGGQAQAAQPGGGGGTGSAGSFSTLRTAYDGLTSPGGLGPMFPGGMGFNTGFGSIDGVLNAQLFAPAGLDAATNSALGAMGGQFGPATPGALMSAGASPGLTIGSALGPLAAIGGGAYGVYSGLQRGGIGGYTSAAGGAVSTVTGLGMLGAAAGLLPALGVLGPIGLGVGALLAIGGALLPGQAPSGQGQLARTNLNSGEMSFEGLGGKRFSQGNLDAATGSVNNISALAREIGDKLGGARIGGDVAVGVTNGTIYLDVNGQKTSAANSEQGAKDIAAAAARMVLNEFNSQGTVQGDYRGIIAASGDSLEALSANLEFYEKTYKALTSLDKPVSAFDQSLKTLTDRFEPAIQKANELGLSVDAMTAARERELGKLIEARDAQVWDFRVGLVLRNARANGDFGSADLLAFDEAAKKEIDTVRTSLEALGVSAADVAADILRLEETQALERLNIVKTYGQQIASAQLNSARTVLDYLNNQALGATSSLSPTARLAVAEQQFNEALSSGDAGRLTSAADALLTNSQAVFGGATETYAQREASVRQVLINRGTSALNGGGDAATVAALSQMTVALTAELASLRASFDNLVNEQRRTNNQALIA